MEIWHNLLEKYEHKEFTKKELQKRFDKGLNKLEKMLGVTLSYGDFGIVFKKDTENRHLAFSRDGQYFGKDKNIFYPISNISDGIVIGFLDPSYMIHTYKDVIDSKVWNDHIFYTITVFLDIDSGKIIPNEDLKKLYEALRLRKIWKEKSLQTTIS